MSIARASRITIGLVGPDWDAALPTLQPLGGNDLCNVVAHREGHDPDFLVLYGDVAGALTTTVPRARRVIVLSEPEGILRYQPGFLNQFGYAISPFALPGFTGKLVLSHPAIPWFFGCRFGQGRKPSWAYSFEQLLELPLPAKRNAISAVLSRKSQTPLHRARVAFAEELQAAFPGAVEIFGSGFNPIDDKADAITPFRFHLAVENTRHACYWSEKFADALLGWSLPVYDGCTQMAELFPQGSFVPVNVNDVQPTLRSIGALLDAQERAVNLDSLREARATLLYEHSLPAVLRRALSAEHAATTIASLSKPETLMPNSGFTLKGRLRRLVKGWAAR